MSENCLTVRGVAKSLRKFSLNNLSFVLPKGYIMGLVGSNGAGKTTTIKLILNMLEKEQGNISVLGFDNVKNERKIKQNIGVVFDTNFFVEEWTISDTEKALSPFYDEWSHKTFSDTLDKFQLSSKMKIGSLSRGMQMRLMLAVAFSHNAKLLILDEPTSGLDPLARDGLLEMLQEYIKDGERSVLFSTHITTDLERVADYITVLEHGKLVFTGSTEALLQEYYLIKGTPDELTRDLKNRIIGLRQTSMGFDGLIKANESNSYKGFVLDTPTIDDIVVCISKGGKQHDNCIQYG